MTHPQVTWDQATAWRAARHHLDQRAPREQLLSVVSRLCGLHAQVTSATRLALWARVDGVAVDAVDRALWEERSLVKLWAMRGTLHVLPSDEYPLWQAALSTYDHFEKGAWQRAFLPLDVLDRLIAAVGAALHDRELTREELADEVARRTGSDELGTSLRDSWGAMLKPASFRGQLCYAPSDEQRVRFTRPATWLGEQPAVDPADALAEVIRRYLGAHGPATRDDVARWWAMTPAAAGRLLRGLGDEVTEVEVDGDAMWIRSEDLDGLRAARPARTVRLLPAFDQYVIAATRHAERFLPDPALRDRIYRSQGWLTPVLLVGGRFAGVWEPDRGAGTVTVEAFGDLPRWARRGAADEVERLAAFLDSELELVWGEVAAGRR